MSENPRIVRDYKDLLVWQKAMLLAKEVYEQTQNFPAEEKFGLIAQMRRAAVSVPSNLAEGQARSGTGEFLQFISHAEGSLAELDTQFRLSTELRFLDHSTLESMSAKIVELQKMLSGLRRSLTTNH